MNKPWRKGDWVREPDILAVGRIVDLLGADYGLVQWEHPSSEQLRLVYLPGLLTPTPEDIIVAALALG